MPAPAAASAAPKSATSDNEATAGAGVHAAAICCPLGYPTGWPGPNVWRVQGPGAKNVTTELYLEAHGPEHAPALFFAHGRGGNAAS